MAGEIAAHAYPERILNIPVDPLAQVATAAGGLATGFSETGRQVVGNTDPGDVVRLLATGFPFIEDARWGRPIDTAAVQEYLETVRESGASLREGLNSLPEALGVFDSILTAISGPDVNPQNFADRVMEAIALPDTKHGARTTLEYLDSLSSLSSPSGQMEQDLQTLLQQITGDGKSVAARNVADKLRQALEGLASTNGDQTRMPALRPLARHLAALALKKLTGSAAEEEIIKVAAPQLIEEASKALGGTTRVRRSLVGVVASNTPGIKGKVNDRLALPNI